MATINVYEQYFKADCIANGVQRNAVSVLLISDSECGNIRYEVAVNFFPHNADDDFAISYDAYYSRIVFEASGRRSKKREKEFLDNTSNTEHTKLSGKAKRYNYSVLPAMKVDWLRKKYIGLYSKAALGISIMCESQKDDMERAESTDYSDTTVIPNIQLTFIGFEAGSETWRGFAEYGFGEQGILSAGLRYKF